MFPESRSLYRKDFWYIAMKSNTLDINIKNDLVYITFPKLSACGAVRHAFSTRHGGVSSGYCSSMNLSFSKEEERANVEENYRIICSAAGIATEHLVLSRQTHTNNVRIVTKEDCGIGFSRPSFEDVDGLITAEPGVALVTQYADCTPLLFCDPVKRVAATSHAGWRGTALQIGRVTVERMQQHFGCRPENIIAAIGPCIGPCCYEVDEPVRQAFSGAVPDLESIFAPSEREGHYMLDLCAANREILINSGILPENIDVSDICTCCNSEELFSHRATAGKRGNMAAIIELV